MSKIFMLKNRFLCHCLVSASHLPGTFWRAWRLALGTKLFHFCPVSKVLVKLQDFIGFFVQGGISLATEMGLSC